MASQRIFHPFLTVWLPAATLAVALTLAHGVARADGPPLILSTQTGINDGQKGVVLQNAPLEHKRILAAQKPAAPVELAPDTEQQPNIIVEPRINIGGARQSGSTRSSSSASQSTSTSNSFSRSSLRSQATAAQ